MKSTWFSHAKNCDRNFTTLRGFNIHRSSCERNYINRIQSHYNVTLENDLNYSNDDIENAMVVNTNEIPIERENIIMPNVQENQTTNENQNRSTDPQDITQDNNPKLKLGNIKGYQVIKNEIDTAYSKIVKWERNIFELPRGKAGKDIIQELIRLMQLLNNKTTWESLSMDLLVIIFLPLMLQKPSEKSKRKDHVRYLIKRLEVWKAGKIKDLVSECCTIQRRMLNSKKHRQEFAATCFTRLMLQGKVKQALKLVNEDNNIDDVHTMTEEIRNILESKHPDPKPVKNDNIQSNRNIVEEVIF